jgi:hypothetical protein
LRVRVAGRPLMRVSSRLATASAPAQDANPNVQIQALMDEKNRTIDAVRTERQALKDATIFYKIKAAEFKEYMQVRKFCQAVEGEPGQPGASGVARIGDRAVGCVRGAVSRACARLVVKSSVGERSGGWGWGAAGEARLRAQSGAPQISAAQGRASGAQRALE